MSFSFELVIDRACALPNNREQTSPLRFIVKEEAEGYARKVFKPPQSVKSYEVIEVAIRPNSRFLKGQLEFI